MAECMTCKRDVTYRVHGECTACIRKAEHMEWTPKERKVYTDFHLAIAKTKRKEELHKICPDH